MCDDSVLATKTSVLMIKLVNEQHEIHMFAY